jgi:hypothetical protein
VLLTSPAVRLESLRRAYGSLALVFLNTCLLLLALNLALAVVFRVVDGRRAAPQREARSPEALSRHGAVHPGLEREEIRALWEETYRASSGFVYEPFTQFKVRAFDGRYVNIDAHGFRRHAGVGPWPPDPAAGNIFLFGGSTAFGYGVQDDETIAAHLQRYLAEVVGDRERPVRVYNFGRPGYVSTQERLLFERQLTAGVVPDIALFLDGLNDCRIADSVPIFSRRLSRQFDKDAAALTTVLARLPMLRLARAVAKRVRERPASAEPAESEAQAAASMARRYLANKRIIEAVAAAQGTAALFVWQPVSFFGYDRRYLLVEGEEPPAVQAGYRHMAALARDGRLGDSFLWLADMQRGREEPLYVDQAHYSGRMSRLIAIEIGDWLTKRALVGDRRSPAP